MSKSYSQAICLAHPEQDLDAWVNLAILHPTAWKGFVAMLASPLTPDDAELEVVQCMLCGDEVKAKGLGAHLRTPVTR